MSSSSQSKQGTIAVEGARLSYVIQGSGTPCLVIGSATYYPRTFSQQLRKNLELHFVEARHFAHVDPSQVADHVTLSTYADDIEQVRQALGLDNIPVIGHSIHGLIVVEYARRYPQHIAGLGVLASPPVGMDELVPASEQFWQTDASPERKAALARSWESTPPEVVNTLPPSDAFIRTYVLNGPKYWYDPEYDCSALWAGVTPDMSLTTHLFGSLFAHYDLAQGPELTMPIFLGLGRYDYVVPYTLWEKRQKALPNLTSHLFEHSGHTPQFEEPTLFDQRLTAWLESLDKK
jgi:proline iminopeptidase